MQEIIKLLTYMLLLLSMIIDNMCYLNYIGWILLIITILASKLTIHGNTLDFEYGLINWINRIRG